MLDKPGKGAFYATPLGDILAQKTITRVLVQTVTLIAFLCSCLITAFFAAGGGMAESVMWFYMLLAFGLGTIIAALPVIILKPSRFERAFNSRLAARLNLFRLVAYGCLIVLASFACAAVINLYQVTHPVY